MKTLTLTDETGKVIFQKTVHNWRVSEAGDQVHISVVPHPLPLVKIDSDTNPPWKILGPSHPYPTPHKTDLPAWARVSYPPPTSHKDGPNPCGEVPLNMSDTHVPEPGVSGGPLTREAWPSWAKKMAEEQEAAVAGLVAKLAQDGPQDGRAKPSGFPKGDCTILWGPKRPAHEASVRRTAVAVAESNREFIKKVFPNGLVGIEDRFRFRALQGPKPTKNMLLMNLTEQPDDLTKAELYDALKCRCDIKDLMSTGHAPKCPEAKKR